MKTISLITLFVMGFVTLTLWEVDADSANAPDRFVSNHSIDLPKEHLQPFLQNYCIKCHGPEKQKGQVRFDQISWNISDNDTAQRWQDVLDQLNGGDMPPEDEEQPSVDELAAVLDELTGAVVTARKRLTDHGGEIKMRRLNKREYANTIRHLFGFDVDLNSIPSDGEIETFDTVGAEQFFTSAHFDKYHELGLQIANKSLQLNTRAHQKIRTERTQPERQVTKQLRKKVAESDRQRALKNAGKSWKEMGFKDEGAATILFKQWDSRVEIPRNYLKYPKVDTGIYNCDIAKWAVTSRHVDHRADYIIRIHGGVVGDPSEPRKIIRLWNNHRIHGTLKMSGSPNDPQTVEMKTRQPINDSRLSVRVRENQPDDTINSMRGYLNKVGHRGDRTDPRAAIWIDWLEIEGPYYPKRRPKFEDILYPGRPTGSKSPYLNNDRKTRELIEQFTYEAFRRVKPDPQFLDALYRHYQKKRKSGANYKQALAEVISIVLASPGFLFLQEATPAQEAPHDLLSNRELAVRLSYFLWSSPPDDELYASKLTDPAVLATQIDRLLSDPRSKALRDGFISQWAEFDRYDAITVDRKQHFLFNEGVQQDAKQEVREFFGALINGNLPAHNLIDSNFITINAALAVHYGLPFPKLMDNSFIKVPLPPNSPRGGMITQAAFLTTGSNGERSSPVIRGALVMEKLLHDKPAPPPPNVPELDEASDKPMTNRQMVLLHQQRATCASCHVKMDAIGFGLENFDTTGRWRDVEKVGRKRIPIQPAGSLPGGVKFNNVTELKKVLLTNEHYLAEQLTESLLAYALGRTIEFSDADDVDAIVSRLKKNNYPMRDMIREIALSPLFRKK